MDEQPHIVTHNARWGMFFFAIYLAFYAVFVALCVFRPDVMAREFAVGINLAIWYGLALIVSALALALMYMTVTKPAEAQG